MELTLLNFLTLGIVNASITPLSLTRKIRGRFNLIKTYHLKEFLGHLGFFDVYGIT